MELLASVFMALLLSIVAPALAQVEEVYYDPSMITDAAPENVSDPLARHPSPDSHFQCT
jgi:hypothetical protein